MPGRSGSKGPAPPSGGSSTTSSASTPSFQKASPKLKDKLAKARPQKRTGLFISMFRLITAVPNSPFIRWEKPMRKAIALTCIATAAFATSAAWGQSGDHLEIIHHPNYDKSVFMPFSPAIKIKSGKILWLAGGTALPVYHDHPHKREQILKHLPNDLEAQTRQAMDGIMETLKAAGASPKDVVHVFIFRARPRMGDIGKASAVVNSYFAPHNHKPATTNMAVLELGEPEQLIEIQVVAVVD